MPSSDDPTAPWRERQASSSPPISPNTTPPPAQRPKTSLNAALPRASPCGSDKILESTDEERALASFSFQAPALAAKGKAPHSSTGNTTDSASEKPYRPLSTKSSFFSNTVRPFGNSGQGPATDATRDQTADKPAVPHRAASSAAALSAETLPNDHASDATPPQPYGQKRSADTANLNSLFARIGNRNVFDTTKRKRPSSPLVNPTSKAGKNFKALLARSSSTAFPGPDASHSRPTGPHTFTSSTSASPAMRSLLLGTSANISAFQPRALLTPGPTLDNDAQPPSSPRLGRISEIVESPATSPRLDAAAISDTSHETRSILHSSTQLQSDSKGSDVHSDQSDHMQNKDRAPSVASDAPDLPRNASSAPMVQSSAQQQEHQLSRASASPVIAQSSVREAATLGACSDLEDVWSWLLRQRQHCNEIEAQLKVKDTRIETLEQLKAEKEEELRLLHANSEKLLSTISERTTHLSDFRETLEAQKLENTARNELLTERTKELLEVQQHLASAMKRDEEEKTRLESEVSEARGQVIELRVQRDASAELIRDTKDRLQTTLFDLAEARNRLSTLEQQKEDLSHKMMNKEEELAAASLRLRDLDHLSAQYEALKIEKEQVQSQAKAAEQTTSQQIEELQTKHTELLAAQTASQNQAETLQQELREYTTRYERLEQNKQNAYAELKEIQLERSTLQDKITHLGDEVTRLNIECQVTASDLRAARQGESEAEATSCELREQLERAKSSLTVLENELSNVKQENSIGKAENERLRHEVSQHAIEMAKAQHEKELVQASLSSHKQALEDLKEQRKSLQSQLEDKDRQLNDYMELAREGNSHAVSELAKVQGKFEVASERLASIWQQLVESENRKSSLAAELAEARAAAQSRDRDETAVREAERALLSCNAKLEVATRERDEAKNSFSEAMKASEVVQRELDEAREELRLQSVEAEEGRRAVEREKTLLERYQAGQLTDAETQLLAQAVSSNAEQVARELSKRDNLIKGLEYEKRSFLDKLKKAQQEVTALRRGVTNASRRSLALPPSDPGSEGSTRVRFADLDVNAASKLDETAAGSVAAPGRTAEKEPTKVSRHGSSRHAMPNLRTTGRASLAGSALQALAQTSTPALSQTKSRTQAKARDEDEISNDADAMQENVEPTETEETSSARKPHNRRSATMQPAIGASFPSAQVDLSLASIVTKRARRVRLS